MKTMNVIKSTIFLTALFLLPAFVGAQEMSEVRETGEFSAINAGSIFKIELIKGDQHSVEITADEQYLADVETSVHNGVLHLDFKGTGRNVKASAVITMPELKALKLSGAASLTSEGEFESPEMKIDLSGASSAKLTVRTSSLESKISGAANLRLSGQADAHNTTVSGAAQLKASGLNTNSTRVKASGASYARVSAEDFLDANASGTSKVSYDNEPEATEIKTSGMGSINGTQAHMVTENGDTTRIKIGNRDLIVIDSNSGEQVKIESNNRNSFKSNWSGFEMGINGYMAPDYNLNLGSDAEMIDLRYEKSFVYNLNLFQQNLQIVRNHLALYTGVGVGFNNYRFDNQTRVLKDSEGVYFMEDTINKIVRNKIHLTYIYVPLMLEFQTAGNRQSEKFHIAGGVIVGARVRTNTKYIYDDNGKKRKERQYDDFAIAPFKFDLSGRLGWGRVNVFATYSLNTLFKEGKGPELYPFTVGLRLINF